MKLVLLTLIILVALFATIFFILAYLSKSGVAPGLANGQLAKCPDSPNCVCSEYPNDSSHYVTPLILLPDNSQEQYSIIKAVIADMGGYIEHEEDNYLAASFSSAIFGFVDDIEIRLDPVKRTIHMRSASRVGRSDAGVNAKRLQLLTNTYNSRMSGLNVPDEKSTDDE